MSHGGFDGKVGTKDDIKLTFDEEGKRTGLSFAGKAELDVLVEAIENEVSSNNFAALTSQRGTELVSAVQDLWGNPYTYTLINRNRMRISSSGPDGKLLTPWDQNVTLEISRPQKTEPSSFAKFFSKFRPETPWLEKRKAELGVKTKREANSQGPLISRSYSVGGLVKLEGASYFWFFTIVMLGAASVFVVVAKLYKPKEYFHDEEIEAEAREEAIGN